MRTATSFPCCEVVFCELVVAGRDAAMVLYLVEESLNQVAGFVEVGAEADWVLAVCLRRDVCPCILRGHCGTHRVESAVFRRVLRRRVLTRGYPFRRTDRQKVYSPLQHVGRHGKYFLVTF